MNEAKQTEMQGTGSTAATTAIAEHRSAFTALGILLVILGILAVAAPLATTIVAKIFLGWLLLITGVAQVIHAFHTSRWQDNLFNLLIGLLYVVVGGCLALFPLTGVIGLTALVAALFVAEGIVKLVAGISAQPDEGKFWLLGSGIVALLAGALIFLELPESADWAIGLIVGINILFTGFATLSVAWSATAEAVKGNSKFENTIE